MCPTKCPLYLEAEISVSFGIFTTKETCRIASILRLIARDVSKYTLHCSHWATAPSDAEEAEKLDERDEVLQGLETRRRTSTKWKHISLETLFGGTRPVPAHLLQTMEEEEEAAMMQAMAEADEDERPDDGEVEIPSKDEYH